MQNVLHGDAGAGSEQREEYSYGLAAGETSSFKVSFTREFPATNYVKPVVRIVGATDMRSRF
jgi:hypothetical protein